MKIHQIIDEGFHDSVTEQLVKCFNDTGRVSIYFRSTNRPEIMLASVDPITDKVYADWCKKEEENYG